MTLSVSHGKAVPKKIIDINYQLSVLIFGHFRFLDVLIFEHFNFRTFSNISIFEHFRFSNIFDFRTFSIFEHFYSDLAKHLSPIWARINAREIWARPKIVCGDKKEKVSAKFHLYLQLLNDFFKQTFNCWTFMLDFFRSSDTFSDFCERTFINRTFLLNTFFPSDIFSDFFLAFLVRLLSDS